MKIESKVIIAIFHHHIQIIKRSLGRSAVTAAAYRSGEKLTNDRDGLTHDYSRKGGVIHSEILLPAHAPPEYADRSTLWNAVEQIETGAKAQLAREINVAIPSELPRAEQIKLVRDYCNACFVSAGMCADFAIHDTGGGNPHAHIMLTMRPFKDDGTWDDKQRKVYHLDENGGKIYDPVKRQYDCETVFTTDWNEHSKAEEWREAWANMANRCLEQNGIPERIDHRSYKRQGIEQIPTIHLGVAATQMEKRGIRTEKGDVNRRIAADNKLLKELKARVTRLYNWSDNDKPDLDLQAVLQQSQSTAAKSTQGKISALKANAKVVLFLQSNGITSLDELYNKVKSMNAEYYSVRGEIVSAERAIANLTERLTMWNRYQEYKPVRKKLDELKPKKRAAYAEEHHAELAMFESAVNYLDELKSSGEPVTPKKWQSEIERLTVQKDKGYTKMHTLRDDIKAAEKLKKAAEALISDKSIQKDTEKQQLI